MGVWEMFQTQESIPDPNTEFKYPVLHAVPGMWRNNNNVDGVCDSHIDYYPLLRA